MDSTRRSLFILQQSIRDFFRSRRFLDVLTPPAVPHPGMETHLHPFQLFSKNTNHLTNLYLQTSPEFALKELLSQGFENLFSLSYCFRDEPNSQTHRCQFLMLEWYRVNEHYEAIEQDVVELLEFCRQSLEREGVATKLTSPLFPKQLTVEEAFLKWVGFSWRECETEDAFKKNIFCHFPQLLPKEELEWEDLFFLVFLNIIEPQFKNIPLLILKEYPARMAALSTIKREDPQVCERFEVYLNGAELANCFNELSNLKEQKHRFQVEAKRKQNLYNYALPEPDVLYKALENGLPPCSGIALGVERLLMGLTGIENPFYDNGSSF